MDADTLDPALPPPERANHDELVITDVQSEGRRAAVRYPRKIDKYFAQGRLGKTREENAVNYEAAVRYLDLTTRAMPQQQSTLANLQRVDVTGVPDNQSNRVDAITKLVRLHRDVGRRNTNILIAVIWEDMSAHAALCREYRAEGRSPPRKTAGLFLLRGALRDVSRCLPHETLDRCSDVC